MTSALPQSPTYPPSGGFWSGLRRAEAWLDARGKGAWIATMVISFILFWPLGLALLAYLIWGKHMFGHCAHRRDRRAWKNYSYDYNYHWGPKASGNRAFDSYRAETLQKLEEEQRAFEGFLERLRRAKDQSEFDAFMDERAAEAKRSADDAQGEAAPEAPRG